MADVRFSVLINDSQGALCQGVAFARHADANIAGLRATDVVAAAWAPQSCLAWVSIN
jgi:hypothetical protein